jgi:outer membrane receptor protein involved in Fe transport
MGGCRTSRCVKFAGGGGGRTNWQVALNVNNVFDKRYYLSDATPYTAFWYGEPRNFMFRIDAKY